MVDAEIYRQRAALVLHHLERLRARDRSRMNAETLRDDEDLWNLVLMDVQQAIQGCIDLAVHACVDERIASPTTSAEAFVALARAKRIDHALAQDLVAAAGLRNLIVHQYGQLDADIVATAVTDRLGDLERFLAAIRPGA